MKKGLLIVICVNIVLFVLSCSEGEVYYRFQHIDKGKWDKENGLMFNMDSLSVDPAKRYDISIEISSNNAYRYQDVWFFISHTLTDSVLQHDTVHCYLADSYGKWLGSGVGGLNQLSFPHLTSVQLDTARNYQLRIRQGMSDNPLTGIEKIGIKVMKSDK